MLQVLVADTYTESKLDKLSASDSELIAMSQLMETHTSSGASVYSEWFQQLAVA